MSEARSQLLQRLKALELGIESDSVEQRPPAEDSHNQVASLFRQGMAVVAFVALEDFIKKRASEALAQISQCGISFTDLPDKLRRATTHEAFGSVAFQLRIRALEEREGYAQDAAGAIFSTVGENYDLYKHSFGFDTSNIGSDVISNFLAALCVRQTWQNMTALASQIDLGLDLKSRFDSCARLRHKAAHVPNASIAVGDLETLRKNCIAISICFDALLEAALHSFRRRERDVLSGARSLSSEDVVYCKIRYIEGKWKVVPRGTGRTLRAFGNRLDAENFVLQRNWSEPCCAIFYGEDRFASDWRIIR